MPVQNCSLLKGIRIYSDELHNGSFLLGPRYAPSICRSIISETGRDVLWGKAEEEVMLIIITHLRRILKRSVFVRNVRLLWEVEYEEEDEEEQPPVRRGNVRAIYLFGKEKEAITSLKGNKNGVFKQFCKWDQSDEQGGYLICRGIALNDWDKLMVEISMRSLPFVNNDLESKDSVA